MPPQPLTQRQYFFSRDGIVTRCTAYGDSRAPLCLVLPERLIDHTASVNIFNMVEDIYSVSSVVLPFAAAYQTDLAGDGRLLMHLILLHLPRKVTKECTSPYRRYDQSHYSCSGPAAITPKHHVRGIPQTHPPGPALFIWRDSPTRRNASPARGSLCNLGLGNHWLS